MGLVRRDEAEAEFRRGLTLDPDYSPPYVALANIALDILGTGRRLLQYAGAIEGAGRIVLAPRLGNIVRSAVRIVTPRPLRSPGTLGMSDRNPFRRRRRSRRSGRRPELWDQSLATHQIATFKMAVTAMLASDKGMRNFQAKVWSWSSRNRG